MDINELAKSINEQEKEFSEAIGEFSINFSFLENQFDNATSKILELRSPQIADLLFGAIQSVSTRLDILSSLVGWMPMTDEVRGRLQDCVSRMRALNNYRNRLLHGPWDKNFDLNGEWDKTRPRVGKKLRYQKETFTAADIRNKSKECFDLIVDLNFAMMDYSN